MKKIYIIILFIIMSIIISPHILYDESININNAISEFTFDEMSNRENYENMIEGLKLQYNNNDIVGVLSIVNSDYKVPVVQSSDNDFYLNHGINKVKNKTGSIFLDYRVDINNSKKLLIYGHNSKAKEMPFKILENYYNENYLTDHNSIEIITKENKKVFQIFSVYVETTDFSYMKIDFNNNEYLEHLKLLKNKSMHKIESELSFEDEILILQTCSTHEKYKKYSKKYLLIIARRIN